jgi:tetratricopeptide (TPR) repeat protein
LPACQLASLLLPSSCAYYNGMYNANRYVKQAERSERLGRPGEASDRWRLAAIHAESVTVRHPHSRWADDAMLVRGRALVHLESWNSAVVVLEDAVRTAPPGEQRLEAQLNLGRANLAIHRYPDALRALDSAALSGVASRRAAARLYRGRTWMAMGRLVEALDDFRASETLDARYERVAAALAVNDSSAVAAFADELVAQPFIEGLWLRLLDGMGHAGAAERAGALVDRLVARRDVSPGAQARLLLADGDRRAAEGDAVRAAARYRDAARAVPDSGEARFAAVRLARMELRTAGDSAGVENARQRLERIVILGGAPGSEAEDAVRLLRRSDSLAAAATAPDAFWFLRAELLRDSLGAAVLAAATFAEMTDRFPDSPWTPKGLLAAIIMGHPASDSLRAVLTARYPQSPYTRIATGSGDDPLRYAALEDSLRQVLAPGPGAEVRAAEADDPRDGVPGRPPANRPARPPTQPPVRPVPTTRRTIEP